MPSQLSKLTRRALTVGLATVLSASLSNIATAQEGEGPVAAPIQETQTAAQIQAYWTAERMQNAIPMDVPGAIGSEEAVSRQAALPADAEPMVMPGWDPNSGKPQPTDADLVTLAKPAPGTNAASPQYGFNQPPANPVAYADYGKYQRWSWFGRYLTYPTSVIGKLFFTLNGSNFVCSGTVINRDAVTTAGHCLSDGSGTWATNVLFCPSYNNGGVNPSRGCWAGTGYMVTTSDWHNSSDFDRDYACFVTQTSGTVVNDQIGDVTGWAGWAVNFGTNELVIATGYPQGAPFNGRRIMTTAAPEWYAINLDTSDSHVSKYIGNDMTGGSSGGGWFLGWEHRLASVSVPDVDGSNTTDPGPNSTVPFWNGLNSHKRCRSSCFTPPTASAGTFWSEMGSPNITRSNSDNRDWWDIYQLCLSNGGS